MKREFSLEDAQDSWFHTPSYPMLAIIGGATPYLWIGNDSATNKACYATLTGKKALLDLCNAIHSVVDPLGNASDA